MKLAPPDTTTGRRTRPRRVFVAESSSKTCQAEGRGRALGPRPGASEGERPGGLTLMFCLRVQLQIYNLQTS